MFISAKTNALVVCNYFCKLEIYQYCVHLNSVNEQVLHQAGFLKLFNLNKYVRYNQLIFKKIAVYKPNAVKIYLIWYDTGKNGFNF